MKKFLLLTLLVLSVSALAHNEGHGPKLTDTPKHGGAVSPVIDAKEASKGAKASIIYKAELKRSEDGSTAKVYFYDKDMNPLDLAKFGNKAAGVLEFKKKKKWTKSTFELELKDGVYIATLPKAGSKPFNIDVRTQEGDRALLAAFDNLD